MSIPRKYRDSNGSVNVSLTDKDTDSSNLVRVAVLPFIKRDDTTKFFVGQSRDHINSMMFFGGGIDQGENWKESLVRELEEESYDLINLPNNWIDNPNNVFIRTERCLLVIVELEDALDKETLNMLSTIEYNTKKNMGHSEHLWETFKVLELDLEELKHVVSAKNKYPLSLFELDRVMMNEILN